MPQGLKPLHSEAAYVWAKARTLQIGYLPKIHSDGVVLLLSVAASEDVAQALDLGADAAKLFFDALVAAVDVVNAI
jgi:hypothetical protein